MSIKNNGTGKNLESFYFNKILKPILKLSKLGRTAIQGEADSGLNLDNIYRNRPKGVTKFGKFLDSLLLNLPSVKLTREKKDTIIKIVKNEVENNILLGRKTRILDIASGPGRYVVESINKSNQNLVEALCLDLDRRSINFGKILASNKPVRYAKADVLRAGHLKSLSKKAGWIPNIIIVSGFFELQSDDIVQAVLKDIYRHLDSQGLVLFTSQASNPSDKLMKKLGVRKNNKPWALEYRTPQILRKWLIDIGFRDVIISLDKAKMYEFCTGRKI